MSNTDVAVLVAKVNQVLLDGEPYNISVDEQNDYTGYKPQAVVDAMNEGMGIGNWGFEEICSTIETTQGKQGPSLLAVAQVKVWLKDVEFKPTSWGQNRVTRGDLGDARKGAQTDAIKKALSYFSIGNRAYHGLLEKNKKPAAQPTPRQALHNLTKPGSYEQHHRNEATPASNGHAEPEPIIDNMQAVLNKCRNRAFKLGIKSIADYNRFCQEVIGKPVPETLVDINRLNVELATREQPKTA